MGQISGLFTVHNQNRPIRCVHSNLVYCVSQLSRPITRKLYRSRELEPISGAALLPIFRYLSYSCYVVGVHLGVVVVRDVGVGVSDVVVVHGVGFVVGVSDVVVGVSDVVVGVSDVVVVVSRVAVGRRRVCNF